MNDSAALLRLLEPAVRPVGLPGASGAARAGVEPIERRSFESLLAGMKGSTGDANTMATTTTDEAAAAGPVNALRGLMGFAAVENASLRGLMGRE